MANRFAGLVLLAVVIVFGAPWMLPASPFGALPLIPVFLIGMADVKITFGADTSELTAGSKQAEGTLGGFGKTALAAGATVVALWQGVKVLGGFLKDSVSEAMGAERSLNNLKVALGNAGTSWKAMGSEIEQNTSKLAKATKFSDDEFTDALANMTRITGDARGSLANLSVVADLAVAKNLDLGAASDIVAKAMAGNTTQLTRLFPELKGSTDAVGALGAKLKGTAEGDAQTFAGRLDELFEQFGEVKEAIGGVATGSGFLNKALETGIGVLSAVAGWIGRNAESLRGLFGAIGSVAGAFIDFGKAIWDTIQPAFKLLGGEGGLFPKLIRYLLEVGAGFRAMGGVALVAFGAIEQALGAFVEKAGKILKLFGVTVVSEYGSTLREVGQRAVANGQEMLEKAAAQHEEAQQAIRSGRLKSHAKIEADEKQHTNTVVDTNKAGAKAVEKAHGDAARVIELEAIKRGEVVDKISKKVRQLTEEEAEELAALHLQMEGNRQKVTRETNDLLAKTAELLKKQNVSQHAEQWAEVDRNVRRVKGDLSDTLPPADALKKSIEENKEAMEQNAQAAKDNKEKISETVGEAAALGRSFIDAGTAAGVISAEAASALNSVINLGQSLAQIGIDGLSVGGIIGVVSALANLLSGIGDNAAAKVVKENTRALERLTREVGNLNLSATGKTFEGTENAIEATIAALRSGKIGGDTPDERGRNALAFFRRSLVQQGVASEDAEKLFDQLGLGEALKTGGFAFMQSLPQLLEGLRQTEFGQFGQDFESQLEATQDRLSLDNVTDPKEQLAELLRLAGRFSPAIAGTGGDADALRTLFNQLINGGLDPEDFGDLSGEQFKDLLKLLIPLADAAGGAGTVTIGDKGDKPDTPPEGGKGGKPGVFGPGAPPIFDGSLDRDKIAALVGFGNAGADMLGSVPPIVPSFNRGASAAGGGHFEQSIGQYVSGDLNMNTYVTPPVNVDPQEIAVIVRQLMADAYTNQRQALGQG